MMCRYRFELIVLGSNPAVVDAWAKGARLLREAGFNDFHFVEGREISNVGGGKEFVVIFQSKSRVPEDFGRTFGMQIQTRMGTWWELGDKY